MDKKSFEKLLGTGIRSYDPLSGGDVSRASRIRTDKGDDWVLKQNSTAPAGMFEAEADGLARIRNTGTLRVPDVIRVKDGDDIAPDERFIVMQFIPPSNKDSRAGRKLGERLARMHGAAPSPNGSYGLECDNFLGRRPQRNPWTEEFAAFYRDQRIAPVMKTTRGKLPGDLGARVDRLTEAIPKLLDGLPHQPCLIHGDLWSGNYIAADDPAVIDPAVYYGHPEIEWAYIELFGGFPSGMREGYESVLPLDPGYERRRPLLQLYHLLVHVDHFGGPYVGAVDRVCRNYGI